MPALANVKAAVMYELYISTQYTMPAYFFIELYDLGATLS